MKNNRKAVVVKNLSYTYPDGTNALEKISFEIYNGESVALVGSNGQVSLHSYCILIESLKIRVALLRLLERY